MYQMGATIKIGEGNSFEFARVDISITKPCEVDNIDSTYQELKDDVNAKLEVEVNKIRGN